MQEKGNKKTEPWQTKYDNCAWLSLTNNKMYYLLTYLPYLNREIINV